MGNTGEQSFPAKKPLRDGVHVGFSPSAHANAILNRLALGKSIASSKASRSKDV